MDKLRAISPGNNQGLSPQLKQITTHQDTNATCLPAQMLSSQSLSLVWPNGFLRERVETASQLKNEIEARGVEIEAASFTDKLRKVYGAFSIAKTLYDAADRLGAFDPSGRKANINEVNESIVFLWGEQIFDDVLDFGSTDPKDFEYTPKSKSAIDKIKMATIANPQELTFKIERAYRDLWVLTTSDIDKVLNNREENIPTQLSAISLLGILDGMYKRDDIGTCSLRTDTKSYHGWQFNRKNQRTIGIDLGQEENWYGFNDTLGLFCKILMDTIVSSPYGNLVAYRGYSALTKDLTTVDVPGNDKEIIDLHRKVLGRILKLAKERGVKFDDSVAAQHFNAALDELKKMNRYISFNGLSMTG